MDNGGKKLSGEHLTPSVGSNPVTSTELSCHTAKSIQVNF